MKFRSFNEYLDDKSGDINMYIQKVGIATNNDVSPIFKKITSSDDIEELSEEIAVILSDDYLHENSAINEHISAFNNKKLDLSDIRKQIGEFRHIPKKVTNIQEVKKLKFPIIASNKSGEYSYKTIGKLKASESIYKSFKESIVPKTRFNILAHKNKAISIVERINRMPLDVDVSKFSMLDQINDITNKIYETYSLDFYNIEVLESSKGTLYINSIDRNIKTNPRESVLLYENAYLEYNKRPLPNWVKNQMIKEYVVPYYKNKKYDSMMIKSKHTMDYSKYLNS